MTFLQFSEFVPGAEDGLPIFVDVDLICAVAAFRVTEEKPVVQIYLTGGQKFVVYESAEKIVEDLRRREAAKITERMVNPPA